MIYILSGNDNKKKNSYLKKLCQGDTAVILSQAEIPKEKIFEYAGSVSLFGGFPIVMIENLIKDKDINFSEEELLILKSSQTIFVFFEEKVFVPDLKKYKKYATIEDFSSLTTKKGPKMNVFDIAEAYGRRDKIGAWILYREAVSQGTAPEEVSGIIFWKIKTMLLNGTKLFSSIELKNRLSDLVSLYHRAHRGECDFTIGLEQFILSSLSK